MTEMEGRGSESLVDEDSLEKALGRYFGRASGAVLKALLLHQAWHDEGSDTEKVLERLADVNPWIADVLRRAASESAGAGVPGPRTQSITTAHKEDK